MSTGGSAGAGREVGSTPTPSTNEPPFNCDARTLVHDCQREGPHKVHDCSVCGVFWTTRYDDEGNPFAVEVSR